MATSTASTSLTQNKLDANHAKVYVSDVDSVEEIAKSAGAHVDGADGASVHTKEAPVLGHAMLPYFKMAEGFVNFNHGSFGCTPRTVLDKQRDYIDAMEAYPDIWFRQQYRDIITTARKVISDYVNADESGLVFVENASSGINSVLRALQLGSQDTVLYLSTAYSMVVNTLEYLQLTEHLNLLRVQIDFPTNAARVVDVVRQAISKHEQANGPKIKLAIFSHITSVPAIILPIQQLNALCHEHGIQVMIDGAHALGAIPLNLTKLGVDYYTANAHKWLYSPKGTAFLWVSTPNQPLVTPTVISSENKVNVTAFIDKYLYTGTRDYTAYCSIMEALQFREFVGEDRVFKYVNELAVQAGHELAALWGTEVLSDDSMVGSMVNVRLPTTDPQLANNLTTKLFDEYKMYIVVYPLNNQFWTRLSAQIYLELNDFKKMGAIVKSMLVK